MSNKMLLSAFAVLTLFAQTACVTKAAAATCTVEGTKNLQGNASSNEVCANFEARLAQALESKGQASMAKTLDIAIALKKNGSAEARIINRAGGGSAEYPVVAVDVMDRAIAQKDLDQLADSVAELLTKQ